MTLLFRTTGEPRTQLIYFLKKLHKTPIGLKPIVSGVEMTRASALTKDQGALACITSTCNGGGGGQYVVV